MPRKWLFLATFISSVVFCTTLFASQTSDFSLNPSLSNLLQSEGIFYTRNGSLSLSGVVSQSGAVLDLSGVTSVGTPVYFSGNTLSDLNTRFSSPTSLTGGTYTISAFDGSGTLLGSEELIIDKTPPKVQKITYFDLNHNGKIDQLIVDFDEAPTGVLNLPYSTGMTVYTRKGGLMASGATSNLDFSDHIISANFLGNTLAIGLREGDMIKNNLIINANAGSSASDLKFGLYTNATVTDFVGNVATLGTSKFPNSSTGILNGTTDIDFIDTGYLYGSNFSGVLRIQKIDSRSRIGSLVLSGITVSLSEDSFLGDGNTLQIGTGSKIDGANTFLSVGSESYIIGNTGAVLFGKEGFSSAFRTLPGTILSDVSTVSESGIYYTYNGALIGPGLMLSVDYVSPSGAVSLFSGALSGNSTLIELSHELAGGNLRATVSRNFGAVGSTSFSGITIVFDVLTQSSITFAASIVSRGSISDITKNGARLTGVIFRPNISGNIFYGTGELSYAGVVNNGSFFFSGLTPGATYFYRLGLVPFPLWDQIFSETGSFTTLPAAIPPPPISIAFQSTTYVTNQNPLLNEFTCDTTHTDCKINFNLESSFGTGFLASDYFCELDFDLDYESGEEYKCNPNAVTFPRGHDYILRFRIIHTPEVSLFSERTILIHSPSLTGNSSTGTTSIVFTGSTSSGSSSASGISSTGTTSIIALPSMSIAPVTSGVGSISSSFSSSLSSSSPAIIAIFEPTIIVQSGLDANNRCLKSDCTLNFEYKVQGTKEACHWDFPGGSYLSGTENKCNPGYIHYPFGEFSITLRVFEQGNTSNYREKTFRFSNGTLAEVHEAKTSPVNHSPKAMIKLQGTLGKTKIQQGNNLTCLGVDECSINLSGEESYDLDKDKLSYYWNFGNGITSDKENPPAVKYTTGEYSVILRVTDAKSFLNEDTFRISVLGKDGKDIVPVRPLDPNVFSLKITGASPNPLGNDGVSEWVEITNPLGMDIPLLGCTLDDEIGKGSDTYSFGESDNIRASSKKRFYKLQTSLNFNNTGDSVNLSCGGKPVSTLAWDYSVPEGFVVSGKNGPFSGKVRVKVLRVIDGDTIEIELYGKKEKVRLIGVDTPETVDPRKSVQYFGKEASNFTRSQLEGRDIELEFDFNPRDKYNRLLAYVWLNSVNFDLELVHLGYARAYLRFPFRYFKEFEKIGKEAIKNRVGMWADPQMKKMLDTEAKDDKKGLEKQLQEEDKAILDDLIEVTKDPQIGSEKMDAEFLDRLLFVDNEKKSDTLKYPKVIEFPEENRIEDIHISLQGKLSKNRRLSGNRFTCHTKLACSVNFTAGKTRKDVVYLWNFGNSETFYGPNPVSRKFTFGRHLVTLKIFDTRTGNIREENFLIVVEKLMSVKKVKNLKTASVKIEKPMVVKGQDFFSPPSLPSLGLTPLQAFTSAGAIMFVFFGGIYMIVRRKRIII